MSGRPTVALDYHVRPTGYNRGSGVAMFATGDVRRSPSFLEGDRFFSPQSASVDLDDQISAARRGLGAQQFYGTGYHASSDFRDYEIPLPRKEVPAVFDRFYTAGLDSPSSFIPFGRFAESYSSPGSFRNLPFSFREVSNPNIFVSNTSELTPEGISLLNKAVPGGLFPRPVSTALNGMRANGLRTTIQDVNLGSGWGKARRLAQALRQRYS